MKRGLPSVRTFASRWSQGPLSSASPGPPSLGAGPELKCSLQPPLLLSFCPQPPRETVWAMVPQTPWMTHLKKTLFASYPKSSLGRPDWEWRRSEEGGRHSHLLNYIYLINTCTALSDKMQDASYI